MNSVLLQQKIYGAYGNAALRIGSPYTIYRPSLALTDGLNPSLNPITPSNVVAALPASFTPEGVGYQRPQTYGKPLWCCLVDGSQAKVGDYLTYLNPEPHRETFMKAFMRQDSPEYCSACHKVHLDQPVNHYRWLRGFNEYDSWQARWSEVADPQFYNKDRTFVDLAKQVTSEDSALPYDRVPDDHGAEVFLWRKCCLDAYARSRVVLNADGSPAKGTP